MNPKLSIIIPCYNCQTTLKEAFDSCFVQGLSVPFEIIMVDDGSKDGTRDLMRNFLKSSQTLNTSSGTSHSVKLFFHEKNRGGGATRNTAIENASGDVIFCLDSDDVLPANMLSKMLVHMDTASVDGVLFEETHFFEGQNKEQHEILRNHVRGARVTFADLFRKDVGFLTKVNFMYKKGTWSDVGGYPTTHGFDTQSFGIHFLAKGFKASICPQTYYLHRRTKGTYFKKEYAQGKLSFNLYLIYEDIIRTFSREVRETIINYDIFRNNSLGIENIESHLVSLLEKLGENGFLEKPGKDSVSNSNAVRANGNRPDEIFCDAAELYKSHKYAECIEAYNSLLTAYPNSKILMMNIARAKIAQNNSALGNVQKTPEEIVYNLYAHKRVIPKMFTSAIKRLRVIGGKVAGKSYRAGSAVLLSPFYKKTDARLFADILATARQDYKSSISQYSFADFVMPQWQKHMKNMESYFMNDFSKRFLNHSTIKHTMMISTPRRWKNIEKDLLEKTFKKEELDHILREYDLGRPPLNDFKYKSAGNSIHHLYHIAKFILETRTKLADMKTIVEVGGGFGNMAKIWKKISPDCTYIIIDIPIFSYIQSVFLKTIFGIDAVNMFTPKNTKVRSGKINLIPLDRNLIKAFVDQKVGVDLFLSTWALSESNKTMQDYIKSLSYFDAKYLLLAYQKSSSDFNYAEDITNTGDNYDMVYNKETDYVKDNYYLFCKKNV